MHDSYRKIEELVSRLLKLKESFDIPAKEVELRRLESESMDEDLWNNQEKARKLMQELDALKRELAEIKNLDENVNILKALVHDKELPQMYAKDLSSVQKEVERFEIKSFLSGPYDRKDAIVSIYAGQGGTEAMDWVSMLYRMYLRYSERMGFKNEILDYAEGEEAGYKSITFKVEGVFSYGYLKGEAGTHRLVRQSPFNADRLRQTSFALVEVLPELEKEDLPQIDIKDDELEWQFFHSSGHGGQNVQKVSTAVRLKHTPTGIVVTAQTERFQEQNRKIALNLLRSKLWIRKEAMDEKKVKDLKGEYRPASWGNQIRSYVLHPYKMVKDVRTEVETSNAEGVLDGDLDAFIEAEMTKGVR